MEMDFKKIPPDLYLTIIETDDIDDLQKLKGRYRLASHKEIRKAIEERIANIKHRQQP